MARIILEPTSTVYVVNFTGLPATGQTILHTNVDELVDSLPSFPASPPGDGDSSYCQAITSTPTLQTTSIIRFGFQPPIEIGDQSYYLAAYPEMGHRYVTTPSLDEINFKIYKNEIVVYDNSVSESDGTNWVQLDDPTLRIPVEYLKSDAENSNWELEITSDSIGMIRITAVQLVFNTGYVEVFQGGVKLGGIADLGPERTARVKTKVGGAVSLTMDNTFHPQGGVVVSPKNSLDGFNNATPLHSGGILVSGSAVEAFFTKKGFLKKTFNINEDIVFTYSGGRLNNSPNSSLGGEASPVLIETGINNLFDDVSPREADDGTVDYRCFYVFNQHEDETIFNIKSWIDFEIEKGSNVKLGIEARNELQSVILDNFPDSGFFTIRHEASNPLGFAPVKVNVPTGSENFLEQFADNFQEALRLNPDLRDVIVNASTFGTGILFEVLFEKLDGKRQQENLTVAKNELSPSINILVKKVVRGSPINSIASEINIDITPPGGVTFSTPNIDFPFVIPKLREGEGFHLWVERTTTSDDDPIANDGFGLGLSLEPIEPVEVG